MVKQPAQAWQRQDIRRWVAVAAAMSLALLVIPDRNFGPYEAVNLHAWWRLVTLMLWLMLAGQFAEGLFGRRWGLAMAGFGGGFVSSTATIAAMASRTKDDPGVERHASAGAVASTAATYCMLAVLIASADMQLLRVLAVPLLAGFVAIGLAAAKLTHRAGKHPNDGGSGSAASINIKALVTFVALLVAIGFVSKIAAAHVGQGGVLAVAGVTGLVDAHAITGSTAGMHADGQVSTSVASLAILLALTANTFTKMALVASARLPKFTSHVLVSLAVSLAATWIGWLATKYLGLPW
ncbi:MAG: DUF4010 domain-containing protein [Myxococcales bacterium]|nr:DUF4010 domain-containing protein [Myxococcales bacterium]